MNTNGRKMSLDLYEKKGVIGKGSYGEVWLVKHKKDKKQYVLKKLDLQNASKRERKAAEQEAKLLSKLKHPNIVSYKDSFECENGFLFIAMGFCEGGDLYTRLKDQSGTALEERQVVEWFVQIAMALQYMHERNILHRDLKTQNIFLTKSKIIKVGDLGIARVLDTSSDMATTLIGTPYYMSPELFSNKPYNHKSDVWALGCCVYEMTTLKHAFNAKDMNSLVYKILRGKTPVMPKSYSAELLSLIKAMLNHNPDKRPSVNRILRDPYIKKNIAIFLEGTKKSSRRPSSSRSRVSSADSSRRPSTGSDVSEPLDSARSSASSVAGVAKAYDKARNSPPVDIKLEPLQGGPDLEPIKEEPTPRGSNLSGSGESVRSNRSAQSSASSPSERPLPVQVAPDPIPRSNDQTDASIEPTRIRKKKSKSLLERAAANKENVAKLVQKDIGVASQNSSQSNNRRRVPTPGSRSPQRDRVSPSSRQENGPSRGGAKSDCVDSRVPPVASRRSPIIHIAEPRRKNSPVSNHSEARSSPTPRATPSAQARSQPRPLPPRPGGSAHPTPAQSHKSRQQPSNGESGYASSSVSSSAASSQDIASQQPEETPRGPNLSARERRRVQKESETPRTARSVDIDRHRASPCPSAGGFSGQGDSVDGRFMAPRVSADAILSKPSRREPVSSQPKAASKEIRSVANEVRPSGSDVRSAAGVVRKDRVRAPSLVEDSSSSSEGEVVSEEKVVEKEKRRKDKEMSNFISLLDTTLHLNRDDDDDDIIIANKSSDVPAEVVEDEKQVEPEPGEIMVPVVEVEANPGPTGAGKTMTTTGRLWERITILRKDCIRGLGVLKLKEAYDILDTFEADELEPRLVSLLGQEAFDMYAGKIWQLKFCEEAAFGLG